MITEVDLDTLIVATVTSFISDMTWGPPVSGKNGTMVRHTWVPKEAINSPIT